jgi:cytochrome c oxidase subunit 2
MKQGLPRVRLLALATVLVAAAMVALALPALADQGGSGISPFLPQADSPNGRNLWTLYNLISIPALIIFIGVEVALLIVIVRFRRSVRPPGFIPPQWHGNHRVEVLWTVIPTVVIAIIGVLSFLELQRDFTKPTDAEAQVDITITGYQFGWIYDYSDGVQVNSVANHPSAMVVPQGQLVRIRTQGRDVIHSWWVPYLMGKTDAVPGYDNYTWIKPEKTGDYRGECAELCGAGHSTMLILVKVVTPQEYQAWVQQEKAKAAATPSPSVKPSASPSPGSGARTASPSPSPSG